MAISHSQNLLRQVRREERKQRRQAIKDTIEEAIKTLAEGIDEARASEEFRAWLEVTARFHEYSLNNTILIARYKPDATLVAGYRTWQKVHRQVKKGEKGIPIFAPIRYTKKVKEAEEEGDTEIEKVAGFRIVYVFDISQTEGDPLPELDHTLTGDDEGLLEKLTQTARSLGYRVEFADLHKGGRKPNGVASPGQITIHSGLEPLGACKTLTHELAHQLLEHTGQNHGIPREVKELQAEATAYVVLNRLGIDATAPSARYLAAWRADIDKLKQSLETIRATASRILRSLEGKDRGWQK